jgi:drug/metabolite transporter (DMT)-like permease
MREPARMAGIGSYHGEMPPAASPNRTKILLSFFCVYFFWGGTYLAMRFGVEVLPPFVLGSARYLVAAPLLLGLSAIFRLKMWPTRQEMGRLALIGVLMLGCGNTAVIWAEQYIPTGLAALLVASIPLYAALIEVILPRGEGLSLKGWIGVWIGFAGMVFLLWPGLRLGLSGDLRQIIAAAVTLGGALCWTAASVISRRSTIRISGLAAAGWQIVYGGLFNLGLLAVTRDYHGAQWGWKAWGSIWYLVIFGSVVTYTAYIYLLDNVAVSKVATYAYVNPVIAVILGAIVLHERFVAVEYVGMGATLLAVFLVTSSKMKSGKPNVVDEDLAVRQRA